MTGSSEPSALLRLTAREAAQRIARGELTSEALVAECLARIEAREPALAAWSHVDPAQALEQARACDRSPARGPLHGVPVGIKDIIDTRDQPTCYGSRAYAGHLPGEDAACVAALREGGAVILGKTVTTEFAGRDPGPTSHPASRIHSPGGSSSGSAAAVADHMVPLALGSQTAGSTIRPASYCGVAAYKPTFGLLSLAGVGALAERFDTLGLFARDVSDLATLRDVLLRVAGAATSSVASEPPRVRVCRTGLWSEARPETRDALQRAAERLTAAGARVDELVLPESLDGLRETVWEVVGFEMARALLPAWRRGPARLRAATLRMTEAGRAISLDRHLQNIRRIEADNQHVSLMLDDTDIVLTPSAVGEAPEGLEDTGPVTFNFLWHVFGMPAVNLPFATGPNGLPVGIQLVARRHCDDRLLAVSRWAESVLAG
ncbi:MAG: amidase [Gammaproteobacteria bacterium]|nr:amidase [Gammaproteobacteria bacterium]